MTSYERCLNAFQHKKVDKVPVYHVGFSSKIASLILGREAYVGGGIQQWREAKALWEGPDAHREFLERSLKDAFDLAEILDMDIVRPSYWRLSIKPSKKIDDHTFFYGDELSWRIRKFNPNTETFEIVEKYPTPKQITFKDLEKSLEEKEKEMEECSLGPKRFFEVRSALQKFKKERAVRVDAAKLEIPLDPIWLEAIHLRPDLVEKNIELQVRKGIEETRYLASTGAEFIFGGGDLASNIGPIYSPIIFRKFMLPALKKLTRCCHDLGLFYIFCSDGNLWPIGKDLFEHSEIDGYCEIDRRAGMDLKKLRENFPRLTLIGNISSYTMHLGSEKEVEEETIDCIKIAKRAGDIIVGVSNYITPETPPENLWTMIETLNKYR